MIRKIWTGFRIRLRVLWHGYRRILRWLRWPATAVALLILAVIAANLLGSASRSVVEDVFVIEPGDSTAMRVAIDVGRETEVRWELGNYAGETRDRFPLTASVTGPADPITHNEAAGLGLFRFKGGFMRSDFVLQIENRHATETLSVAVRWTIR